MPDTAIARRMGWPKTLAAVSRRPTASCRPTTDSRPGPRLSDAAGWSTRDGSGVPRTGARVRREPGSRAAHQAVLVTLATRAGQVVTVDELADEGAGEQSPHERRWSAAGDPTGRLDARYRAGVRWRRYVLQVEPQQIRCMAVRQASNRRQGELSRSADHGRGDRPEPPLGALAW